MVTYSKPMSIHSTPCLEGFVCLYDLAHIMHGIRHSHCMPPLSDAMCLAVSAVVVMLSLKRRGGGITFHVFCSCDLDLDLMTFIYELAPYPLDVPDQQI